jgi:nanoRNase/pAp phosphatase (c-di-AMP/oligoRNAs hydrolase)
MSWSAVPSDVGRDLAAVLEVQNWDPVTLGLIVLVGLILLVVAWLALRRYRRTTGERFRRVLASRDELAVLLHPNPDPDAMATAMGVALLAEDVGTEASIHFPGEIRHQENRAFRTVLELDLTAIERAADLSGDIVLVDHNEARGFEGASDLDPVAVVDHHPGSGDGSSFTDIRPEYGACATIITEYLRSVGFTVETGESTAEKELPELVATGLLYGILSDTNHLSRGCTGAEFEASSFLYSGIDEDLLDRIAHPEIDAEVLDVKARAIENRQAQGPFVVSHVGELSNVDAIPQAADELLHLEGITAVVVLGEKEGMLHLSGRSRDDRVHMGNVLKQVVEDIPMSGAGGHARMGGGQLSLDHMAGLGPSDGVSIEAFTERLFAAMAGES